MLRIFVFIFFLISNFIFAQYQITIDAYVLDYETQDPIPFSEISFTENNIAALSDKEGKFKLTYSEDLIDDQDLFLIKANGYMPLQVTADQLYKFLRNTNKFYLKNSFYKFDKTTFVTLSINSHKIPNPYLIIKILQYSSNLY